MAGVRPLARMAVPWQQLLYQHNNYGSVSRGKHPNPSPKKTIRNHLKKQRYETILTEIDYAGERV